MSEKKRPLGLGSMGANKAAKIEQEKEEQAEAETMFQMPEGDLSEEAEIKTIFMGAESAYADFKAMDEEEAEEDAGRPEEEQIKTRAVKLYSGVVHECDRLLKLADLQTEGGEKESGVVQVEIFELMGDALFKLGCISTDECKGLFLAAKDKYEAGLEAYPDNIDLIYSKARLEICMAISAAEDDASLLEGLQAIVKELPKLDVSTYAKNLSKVWQSLGEFCEMLEDPLSIEFIARFCLELVPEGAELIVEESLQKASWLAKLIESGLEKETVQLEEIASKLDEFESVLEKEYPDETETQITLGQLKSQFQLLKGSKFALEGNPEEEQKCYEEAHRVFQELESCFGCPIPDFIHDLKSE